ncbi:DUF2953 domain-containing protein [Methanococcoides sp. FTZ1]|uniref:DUF2953 domain-containing protein n=1 Tax=Methanococcoides sp. FTZ1 TaxID=3439061 RepID=UPI003F8721D9
MSLLIYTLSLCIILLLGLILFAPIDIVFNVRGDLNGVHSRADVKWTVLSTNFSKKNELEKESLIDKLLKLMGEDDRVDEHKEKEEVAGKDDAGLRESFDDISTKAKKIYGIRYHIFRLLKGLLCAIHIRELSCDLDYGLPDPADTGMLCGFLHTVGSVVHSGYRKFHYSVTPRFADEGLDVRMSGYIRFRMASLLYPVLRFVFSLKVLRTGWWFLRNMGSSSSGVSV